MLETSNYREVQAKLKRFDAELAKETRRQLRELSVEVASLARAKASWSAKIPAAIRPTVTAKGAGVRVSKTVPIAVLNERASGEWRHPVYGRWLPGQKPQIARPSVRPIIATEGPRQAALGEEIMRTAAAKAGIR